MPAPAPGVQMIAGRGRGIEPDMNARLLVLLAALAASPALAGPRLELEVGAGAWALKAFTPNVTGRVGLDLFGWFTPSLRVLTLNALGSNPTALSILAEGRAHTKGLFQVTGGVAVGFATATVSPDGSSVARAAPALLGDLGVRVMLGPVWLGAGVGGNPLALTWQALLNVGVVAFGSDD